MPDPNYVVLMGKRWRFKRVSGLKDFGSCDAPDKTDKQIKIRKSLKGRDELDTIIHECLHACLWAIDEEYITRSATDIARTLWRIGYRLTPDKGE